MIRDPMQLEQGVRLPREMREVMATRSRTTNLEKFKPKTKKLEYSAKNVRDLLKEQKKKNDASLEYQIREQIRNFKELKEGLEVDANKQFQQ